MIIGYRRVAGRLPLTLNEAGQRGTWLEKRTALLHALSHRGHRFKWLSKPTQPSLDAGHVEAQDPTCDLLILEFGGTNLQFYGKDWAKTVDIIQNHTGRIIFLCDDPDLPFLWKLIPNENWTRWTIAVNAVNLHVCRTKLGIPEDANVIDLPFHGEMNPHPFVDGPNPTAIYYGRPNGRSKALAPYTTSGVVTIAGRAKEWDDPTLTIVTPPEQKDRAAFYQQFRTCLAIYDQKHGQTGWRTGRAYHALNAGIPVAAPVGNNALNWAYQLHGINDLARLLKMTPLERQTLHHWQVQQALTDLNPIYESLGL